jgi:hypothetical protein
MEEKTARGQKCLLIDGWLWRLGFHSKTICASFISNGLWLTGVDYGGQTFMWRVPTPLKFMSPVTYFPPIESCTGKEQYVIMYVKSCYIRGQWRW